MEYNLHQYFQQNWEMQPYPLIDHHLRIDRRPDGSFHFYIHPQNASGETADFIVDEKGVWPREQSEHH